MDCNIHEHDKEMLVPGRSLTSLFRGRPPASSGPDLKSECLIFPPSGWQAHGCVILFSILFLVL